MILNNKKQSTMKYNRVLTIAGSDSGGGAGIQADIKTISANGCFATTAITAITAQNTFTVTDIHPIPTSILIAQIDAVLSDIGTDAVKIGMLHNSETIIAVAETLKKYDIKNIVIDPVMVSTSGKKLLEDTAIKTLKEKLIPMATILTPNIPEAELLLDKRIKNQNDLPILAKELSEHFNNISVLLKAGHMTEDYLNDVLYNAETNKIEILNSQRIYTQNTHGTGCTLSSALASQLARGNNLTLATKNAKDYINEAIIAGKDYEIGKGNGPVKHFYKYW